MTPVNTAKVRAHVDTLMDKIRLGWENRNFTHQEYLCLLATLVETIDAELAAEEIEREGARE